MPQLTAPYRRASATILALLLMGVFVKYSELLFTFEHRALIEPQGTLTSRLKQIGLALRFSWEEFAIAAVLFAMVLAWRRYVPIPGRVTRLALGALRALLIAAAIFSVFGIAYYANYQTHITVADFEYLGWATQILGSANVFQYVSIRIGIALCLVLLAGLPWLWVRLPERMANRLTIAAFVMSTLAAAATWAASRPNLAQASLEPNPMRWLVTGQRAAYINLPPIEALAPIGRSQRRHTPSVRPRNIILVVLESTPARALAGYDPAAEGGRRLFTDYANDITLFEDIHAIAPNSMAALISVLTGRSPVPTPSAALAASARRPTLSETLKSNGFTTHFLMTSESDRPLDHLLARGFDRSWSMTSAWPRKTRHARHAWGYDDRLLFEEARAFLEEQKPGSPPFLLMLHASTPHHPYPAEMVPGVETDPDPRVRHARLVNHLMEQFTDFYGWMKRSGLAENTAVLAYGDHGEAFGEHQGNFIHSVELYAENVHVPMLLLHPRRLGLPARIPQLGTLDDIMPTVLDLLGLSADSGTGMSLLHEAPDRIVFHITDFGPGQVGFRDRRFFYSLSRTGRELLFDRASDPTERHNVLGDHPEAAAAFRARLNVQSGQPPLP